MDTYIIRIYRRGRAESRILIGTVETGGSGRRMAFSNPEELWEILRHRKNWRAPDDPDPGMDGEA